jgi:hypothetical protein
MSPEVQKLVRGAAIDLSTEIDGSLPKLAEFALRGQTPPTTRGIDGPSAELAVAIAAAMVNVAQLAWDLYVAKESRDHIIQVLRNKFDSAAVFTRAQYDGMVAKIVNRLP